MLSEWCGPWISLSYCHMPIISPIPPFIPISPSATFMDRAGGHGKQFQYMVSFKTRAYYIILYIYMCVCVCTCMPCVDDLPMFSIILQQYGPNTHQPVMPNLSWPQDVDCCQGHSLHWNAGRRGQADREKQALLKAQNWHRLTMLHRGSSLTLERSIPNSFKVK